MQIKKGDQVVMWYLSGNRDENVFENPNDLMIERKKREKSLIFWFWDTSLCWKQARRVATTFGLGGNIKEVQVHHCCGRAGKNLFQYSYGIHKSPSSNQTLLNR